MRAIQVQFSIPRMVATKLLSRLYPPVFHSFLGPLTCNDVPEPTLPDENWVKVRTLFGGICSTDLAGIMLKQRSDSYMSAFLSFPVGVGHEAVGIISQLGANVTSLKIGDRVTIDPSLSCVTRGIVPLCENCQAGNHSSCSNFAEGNLPPGLGIGGNNRTGGSWGEYFVVHNEHVHVIPDEISDRTGLLIEPFCCALHAVLKLKLDDEDTVLIFGAGTMGLVTIAALRLLGFPGRILVAVKHPFQQAMARKMGADCFLPPGGRQLYDRVAELTGGRLYHGRVGGNYTLVGGVDAVFDWIGNTQTVTDSLKLLKTAGHMVLGGIGRPSDVDWTALWFQECVIHGSSSHATETRQGKRISTFALAIDLLSKSGFSLDDLLTHTFGLTQYHQAFDTILNKKQTEAIKVAFEFPRPKN